MPQTLIEFYDKSPLENIVSSLVIKPEKIIYLGSNCKQMERQKERYLKLLAQKGIEAEIECHAINKNNLEHIQKILSEIAEENSDCAVDLTGGDELSLVAVGTVAGLFQEKRISLHRINLQTRKVIEFFSSGHTIEYHEPTLSVEENIFLYGGVIVYGDEKENRTQIWNWEDGFARDVFTLWDICRSNCGSWNAQTTKLENYSTPDSLHVEITGIRDNEKPVDTYDRPRWIQPWSGWLFKKLAEDKLIFNYAADEDGFSFECKDEQIQKCLTKAGTVLELVTYITASDLVSNDGTPFFNDVMTGVSIDWDGIIHHEGDAESDTENEIDVIAMKGLIPLFISCKNGLVAEDELYKLNTVATRFGGEYARKVLIATYIDKRPGSLKAFRQRAKDMKIELIEDVHMLNDLEFAKQLKRLAV